jgi:membrane protease subunit HflC
MRMRSVIAWGLLAVVLLVATNALYIVPQTQQALVVELGRPVKVVTKAGLNVKVPFMQSVEYYDKRLLDFDAQPKEVIASDQKRLIVDAFMRYRITDPLKFKQTVRDEKTMRSHLNEILESSLREVFSSVPLNEAIAQRRAELMHLIRDEMNERVNQSSWDTNAKDEAGKGGFGIEIVDVRVMRADLPQANSEGVYQRMKTEREREAKQWRAQGEEEAQKIRATADKDRTVLLAEAKKQAETTRGEGDATATKIFADAFGRDDDFFQFYRTMQIYRKTLTSADTTMVMSPDNAFLKYFGKDSVLNR